MNKKSAIIIISLALLVILAFTLVACNGKNDDAFTYTLDENDGIDNFVLRRGVYFNYIVSEINKIDGVDASWKADGKKVKITVKNGKQQHYDVLKAVSKQPHLSFKTSQTATPFLVGNNNIKSIKLSADKKSIQIEFTSNGAGVINNALNRQIYLYMGDECLITMTQKVMLSSSNATATLAVPDSSDPLYAEMLTAKLNAATFGLKITNTDVE